MSNIFNSRPKNKVEALFYALIYGIIILIITYSATEDDGNSLGETQDNTTVLVSRIVDGDTVQLATGETVRYIGIDTPETKHPNEPIGCYGEAAAEKNSDLVLNKLVRLEKDVSETDRYGRLLRYVWIGDQMINEVLVEEGFARSASFPPDIRYQERFRVAEEEARNKGLGLWGACE